VLYTLVWLCFLGAAAFFPDIEQRHEQLISLLQTSAVRVVSLLLYVSHSELCALSKRTYFVLTNRLSLVAGKEEQERKTLVN